ncbi:MAG: shikimate kinase [Candidatus Limnocylindrales bacterium]
MTPAAPGQGHLVLMGLMGAGKTTVGRAVAARLGWPFHDSDEEIQRSTGFSARRLHEREGARRLHRIEAAHLLGRLAEDAPSVIAAAASTVEDGACRRALGEPTVLVAWLRAAPSVLAARFDEGGDHRPRYGPDRARSLARQAERREPLLASLQPLVFDVDQVAAEAVVGGLAAAVRDRWPSAS